MPLKLQDTESKNECTLVVPFIYLWPLLVDLLGNVHLLLEGWVGRRVGALQNFLKVGRGCTAKGGGSAKNFRILMDFYPTLPLPPILNEYSLITFHDNIQIYMHANTAIGHGIHAILDSVKAWSCLCLTEHVWWAALTP